MTIRVQALIEKLQTLDPKRRVVVCDEDLGEYDIETIEQSALGDPVVALFVKMRPRQGL